MKWEVPTKVDGLLHTPVIPFPEDNLNLTTATRRDKHVAKFGSDNAISFENRKNANAKERFSLLLQTAMIADRDGDRALHIAVSYDDYNLVKILCIIMKTGGASLDVRNYLRQTPLHIAVVVGNPKVVDALLRHGASAKCQNRRGFNAVHLAIKYFNENIFPSLVNHSNMNVSAFDAADHEGLTPLHLAVNYCNLPAIEALCKAGADIDAADGKSGRSSLIHAVLAEKVEMIELLVNECNATIEKPDYSGRNALDFALMTGNRTIIKLLETKTGKTTPEPSVCLRSIRRRRISSTEPLTNSKRSRTGKIK